MIRWSRGVFSLFLNKRSTPFSVFLLFTMISFISTGFYSALSVLGLDTFKFSLIDGIALGEYADNLPILMKLSNQWGYSGYYRFARDVYVLNLFLLGAALIYNSRVAGYWQMKLVSDIDEEQVDAQNSLLDRIESIRKFSFFAVIILACILLFDDVADAPGDYFSNRMMFEPWNAMRVPLITSLVYGALTYLMMSNHVFLFFDDEEDDEEEVSPRSWYDATKGEVVDAVFDEMRGGSRGAMER